MNHTLGLYSGLTDEIPFKNRTTRELFSDLGGNTGNLAFVEAIRRSISTPLSLTRWGNSAALAEKNVSLAVIPCANQFGSHYDMGGEAKQLRTAEIPVVAIGLGAQMPALKLDAAPTDGTIRWVETIADLAPGSGPNIALRGHITYRQLEKFGLHHRAIPLGCPSLFTNPHANLGQLIAANAEVAWSRNCERVAVLAGQPKWMHLQRVERSLLTLVRENKGAVIVQDPLEMFQLARGEFAEISAADATQMLDFYMPGQSCTSFSAFMANHAKLFVSVQSWMDAYGNFDFVIGPRIHGVMLALQAGVPAICVAHDSRTIELCEMMKVPWILPHELSDKPTATELRKIFRFNADEFDKNRKNLAKIFVDFLKGNFAIPSSALISLADSAELPIPPHGIRGVVDSFNQPSFISGWVYDIDSTEPVTVQVHRYGQVVAEVLADEFRSDLSSSYDGKVGFSLHTSVPIIDIELLAGITKISAINSKGTLVVLEIWDELRSRLLTE